MSDYYLVYPTTIFYLYDDDGSKHLEEMKLNYLNDVYWSSLKQLLREEGGVLLRADAI